MAATFTKTGDKASAKIDLPKSVFGVRVENHTLLKQAYETYLANGRVGSATTKTRSDVRGGGKKPWKQKGTGRARTGSIRNPIWRGGGIVFGPTGQQNYKQAISKQAKRTAIKQALSLASKDERVSIIEAFDCKEGKTASVAKLLKTVGAERRTLVVVNVKNELIERATSNLPNVKVTQATYLNVYDILNADTIVIAKDALEIIDQWLNGAAK